LWPRASLHLRRAGTPRKKAISEFPPLAFSTLRSAPDAPASTRAVTRPSAVRGHFFFNASSIFTITLRTHVPDTAIA
jgi:hypothetical protein